MNLIISYPLNINLPVNGDSLSVFAPSMSLGKLNLGRSISLSTLYTAAHLDEIFLQVIWQRKKLWLKTHWSENSTVNIIQSLK